MYNLVIYEGPMQKYHPQFDKTFIESFCTLTPTHFIYKNEASCGSRVIRIDEINQVMR